ncbi:MAG TPA: hypothetical protein VMF30_18035 [Pirellulales bacterium]|nr:hypothetical protein [Pirellulales bacterium]
MASGRRRTLDDLQRRDVLTVVRVTGSRGKAAEYVGCTVGAIEAAARRDLDFGDELQKAELAPILLNLSKIKIAAEDTRHWRAAAWALEHLYPEDYALRRPRSMSAEQIRRALAEFADMIVDEIADEAVRARIMDRVERLAHELAAEPDAEDRDDA